MTPQLSKGSLSSTKIAPTDSRYILEENSYQLSIDYFAFAHNVSVCESKTKMGEGNTVKIVFSSRTKYLAMQLVTVNG